MSKKFIITESERKNILLYYSEKGIILETDGQSITKDTYFGITDISTDKDSRSIHTKTFSFWPEMDFKESGGKLVGNFKIDEKFFTPQETKRFLNQMGVTDYQDKEVKIENIVVEFNKVDARDEENKQVLVKKFLDYTDENGLTKSPYWNLCYDLILKDFAGIVDFNASLESPGNIRLWVNGAFDSITFKVDSEQSVETSPESEKPVETSQTSDSVGDSGLPEGEFEDEVLTKGKTKKPSWLKRLLTREKTELMNNLKSLEGKLIDVNDMVFKISDVKVSSDIQGVLVFSCNQQKINADLVNKPKFKFVGKKDFYFACKIDQGSSIFYDSAQYVYNRQDNIYYGNSMAEIRNKTNYLEEFVFDNICKFINPKK